MNALIFGGQGLSNREWMESLSSKLSAQAGDYETICHEYLAWSSEPDSDDKKQIDSEITNARSKYANRSFDIVIGKSFGCLMALEAKANYQYMILVGPPIKALKKLDFNLMNEIKAADAKVLILVNSNDPIADIANLKSFTDTKPQLVSLHLLDGNQHKYENIEEYSRIINSFLAH